jgi:hypothetical protein
MNWNWELLMTITTWVIWGALIMFFGLTVAVWIVVL